MFLKVLLSFSTLLVSIYVLESSDSYFIYFSWVFSCHHLERQGQVYLPARIEAYTIIFHDRVIFDQARLS